MGAGIEIYDDNGKKIFDNQQLTARIIGSFKITSGAGSKKVNVDTGCRLFIYTYENPGTNAYRRNVWITNGNTINWDNSTDSSAKSHYNTTVVYGEY